MKVKEPKYGRFSKIFSFNHKKDNDFNEDKLENEYLNYNSLVANFKEKLLAQ